MLVAIDLHNTFAHSSSCSKVSCMSQEREQSRKKIDQSDDDSSSKINSVSDPVSKLFYEIVRNAVLTKSQIFCVQIS